MRRLLLLLLLTASALLSGCPTEPPARVYVIETADQRVGGPSALAIEGDWILENEHIRAGILSERCVGTPGVDEVCSSPGPGLFGGSVIDIDLRRHDAAHSSGRGKDQFAEMFSAVNLDVTQVASVEALADGTDGGPAILRVQGPPGDYISYIGLLGGILGLAEGWYVTDYILRPGDPYLTLRTHVVFQSPSANEGITRPDFDPCGWVQGDEGLPCDDLLVEIPRDTRVPTVDALNAAATQFGDFFFAGGNVDIFLPGIGFQEEHAVVDAMNSGVNPFVDPFDLPWVAATGDGVSYALGTGGKMAAPIFTSSLTAVYGAAWYPPVDDDGEPIQPTTADQKVVSYQRFVGLGDGDINSAVDALYTAFADHDMPVGLGTIEGRVLEEGTLAPVSGVDVLVYLDDPDAPVDVHGLPPRTHMVNHFSTDGGLDTIPDGSFSGRLPGGDYILVAKDSTRGLGEPRRVTVPDGGTLETGLIAAQPGTLEVDVVDERGRGLPCKVSLRPLDEYTDISLPDLGDPYIGGGYSKVLLLPAGHGRVELPAGRYDVLITRGLEYGLWDSVTEGWPDGVVLSPGQTSPIDAVLGIEVDSTGFISADLHVHASPSHDSGIPLETRAISMASEGVDFLAGTDHDYITDYKPVIEALELGPWLQAATGLETTTMELGHYIAFPMQVDYTAEAGGALDWTGLTPLELIDALKGMGPWGPAATSVMVAHPRDGILGYFDQYGLDHFSGEFLSPNLEVPLMNGLSNPLLVEDNFTLDFDGFELFNGKRFELIRTPTHDEMERSRAYLNGEAGSSPVDIYEILSRTMEEQEALADMSQDFFITRELEGTVDDWFNLLNLGYRHTGVGNSDTHGISSTEAGCPRNFVISEVDAPELIDERDVATAINEHRVVASYGPIIRFEIDGMPIGSDVVSDTGTVTLDIEVQAPRWMLVDRVELYENGRLIAEFTDDALDSDAVVKFSRQMEVTPTVSAMDATPQDAWYVVVAMGDDDLAPVFTPVDVPHLQLNDIVVGALSEIELGSLGAAVSAEGPPIPTTWPVYPYAITNPIWVDVDGTGNFDPLGHIPYWFRPAPEE